MKQHTFSWLIMAGLLSSSLAHADHHQRGEGMHSEGLHHDEGMRGDVMQGSRIPPMFGQFDKNNDGRVSRDEAREGADRMFGEIDTDKDGFISTAEMQAHHRAMREKFRQSMRDTWKKADADGDGALSRAEVDAAKMPRLMRDFDKLDKNKDGKLSQEEMAAAPRPGPRPAPQP
jgi:Ca2+-binding EF-hand superfamily protein